LIVGDPTLIPFWFQYEIDVSHAVGRLCFEDLIGYSHYVENLIRYESEKQEEKNRLVLFGAENGDELTSLCTQHLAEPLATEIERMDRKKQWSLERVAPIDAKKERLKALMGGQQTPSMLFTISHGTTASKNAQRREQLQGGLVCSDWQVQKGIKRSDCFCADDLGEEADLTGLVAFHFACFTAGTPEYDSMRLPHQTRKRLHNKPFVARLPQAMLGKKNGALAIIGHVGQAYQQSFLWDDRVNEINHFAETLCRIMEGERVGHALEPFNRRFADISTTLMGQRFSPRPPSPNMWKLASWLALQDARSFAVLGDPAVQLATQTNQGDES